MVLLFKQSTGHVIKRTDVHYRSAYVLATLVFVILIMLTMKLTSIIIGFLLAPFSTTNGQGIEDYLEACI